MTKTKYRYNHDNSYIHYNDNIKKVSSPNQHSGKLTQYTPSGDNTLQSPKPIVTSHKSPQSARIPNSDFIPINEITPKEIQELEKCNSMISSGKKRRFNNFEATDGWREPSSNELPWMKGEDDRKYRNVVHRMHFELNDLIDYLSPTDVEKSLRVFVIKRIEDAVKTKIPCSEMFIFGSFNSGIYLPTSKRYSYGKPLVIHKAVVPIIKFKEKYTNINIDISFNQKTVFTSVSTISRYLDEWPILDNDNLGVLLIEFFELYGTQFNYTDLAITVRHGGSYRLKCQQNWAVKYPTTNLCIQDPSDPDNDIARATRNMVEIQKAFKQAFLRLVNRVGQLEKYPTGFHNRSILSSILFVPENMQSSRRNLLRDYNENGLSKLVQGTSSDLETLLKPCDYEFIAKKFGREIEESDYHRNIRVNSLLRKHKPARSFRSQNNKDRNLNKDDYYFEALDSDY
ncbi:5186_t:CDS:2 [Entrophospora sp. SA101]|nr:5186_t:CDS:2 [Entrophospora sp. SA101]